MATYLQLVDQLRQEVDFAGVTLTTLTGQPQDITNLSRWVAQAWVDIQLRHVWKWRRRRYTLTTVADTERYAYTDATDVLASATISRFERWYMNPKVPPRIYLQSSGGSARTPMTIISWDNYQNIYLPAPDSTGFPSHITIDPQDNLVLGVTPNDVYVINGEYIRAPQLLSADSDEPEHINARFHDVIVYVAMAKYAYQQVSQENLARAERESRRMFRQMEAAYSERISFGGPLA